jgi:hypothetical protein
MAKKSGEAPVSKHGINDVIGFVLILFVALPLLCAQLSFDINDISFITTRVNKPPHNWIGLVGAWLAYGSFCLLGGAAYLVPVLAGVFGVSYLLHFFGYLRERLIWHLLWTFVLLISVSGLLYLADDGGHNGRFHLVKGISSAGGFLRFFRPPDLLFEFALLFFQFKRAFFQGDFFGRFKFIFRGVIFIFP